jgi:hypothetical protein
MDFDSGKRYRFRGENRRSFGGRGWCNRGGGRNFNGGLSLGNRNSYGERLYLFDEAAQQAAVGCVGGGAAQALAGQHGALVVGGFGQQQVRRLAVGEGLGQLLKLAHFGRAQGGGAVENVQERSAGHG